MSNFYILKDGEPVQADATTWVQWFETSKAEYEPGNLDSRRVAMWERGGVSVSTVFLGLDHQWEPGKPPLIFETLVRGGELDDEMDRYTTRQQALAGHAAMVARARAAVLATAEGGEGAD